MQMCEEETLNLKQCAAVLPWHSITLKTVNATYTAAVKQEVTHIHLAAFNNTNSVNKALRT